MRNDLKEDSAGRLITLCNELHLASYMTSETFTEARPHSSGVFGNLNVTQNLRTGLEQLNCHETRVEFPIQMVWWLSRQLFPCPNNSDDPFRLVGLQLAISRPIHANWLIPKLPGTHLTISFPPITVYSILPVNFS